MKLSDDAEAKYRKQSYRESLRLIGVEVVELRRFVDAGGSMTELGRLSAGAMAGIDPFTVAQVNYSTLAPGALKAFHVHRAQTDVWYVPPEDRILLVLADVRKGSESEGKSVKLVLGDGRSFLVRIPPGVAHGCRNLGQSTARIVYFTDRHFDPHPEATDEGRLPWDWLGAEIWETPKE